MKVTMQHEVFNGENSVKICYDEFPSYASDKPSVLIKTTNKIPGEQSFIEQYYKLSKQDIMYFKTIFDNVKLEQI